MKFEAVDSFTHFDDETLFWIVLTDPPADIKEKAKSTDGAEYSEACFGMLVYYDLSDKQFKVSMERCRETSEVGNLFYTDNDGTMIWYHTEIPEDVKRAAFAECAQILDGKKLPGGYEVKCCTIYENGCGIILAEHGSARNPFTTVRFDSDSGGRRRYYHQRYFASATDAYTNFERRNEVYSQTHTVKSHITDRGRKPKPSRPKRKGRR